MFAFDFNNDCAIMFTCGWLLLNLMFSNFACADSCKNGAIHCSVDQKCIPLTWKCNGYFDCPSGEDEENCNSPNQVELLPII